MESFKENFKVYVRIRPFLPRELKKGTTFPVTDIQQDQKKLKIYEFMVKENLNSKEIQKILKNPKHYNIHNFSFDKIFGDDCDQYEIFEETTEGILEKFLRGYNVSVLAYGQTGTGKTYTMEGNEDTPGIIYQSLDRILQALQQKGNKKYHLSVQYLQIYNEQLIDLLGKIGQKKKVQIVKSDMKGVQVENLTSIKIEQAEQAHSIIKLGAENRITATTQMNQVSSRSHAIFMLNLQQKQKDGSYLYSNLYLVDLAGSERIKLSKVKGLRLDECKNINKSLSELSNVIINLSSKKKNFVNYRNSKLTRLMENCLGGNSFTSFITTVSPDHESLKETISTLKFASRARNIKSEVHLNKLNKEQGHLKMLEKFKQDFQRDSSESIEIEDIGTRSKNNASYFEDKFALNDKDLQNYNFDGNNESKNEVYKKMLVNQREVILKLSNKLNDKNNKISKMKKQMEKQQKLIKKVDSIVTVLCEKNDSLDLQVLLEELIELKDMCNKTIDKQFNFLILIYTLYNQMWERFQKAKLGSALSMANQLTNKTKQFFVKNLEIDLTEDQQIMVEHFYIKAVNKTSKDLYGFIVFKSEKKFMDVSILKFNSNKEAQQQQEHQLQDLRQQNEQKNMEIKRLKKIKDDQENNLIKYTNEMVSKLNNIVEQNNDKDKVIKKLTQQQKNINDIKQDLEQQVSSMSQQLKTLKQNLEEKNNVIIQNSIEQENKYKKFIKEKEDLQKNLNEVQQQYQDQQELNKQYLQQRQNQEEHYTKQLSQKNDKIKQLEQQVQNIQLNLNQHENKSKFQSKLNQQFIQAQQEIEIKNKKINQLQDKINNQEKQYDDLQQSIEEIHKNYKEKLIKKNQENFNLDEKISKLESELSLIKQQQDQYKNLQIQLKEKSVQIQQKNTEIKQKEKIIEQQQIKLNSEEKQQQNLIEKYKKQ